MRISVVFTGRSYQLARALPEELTLPDGATLDDAINALQENLAEDQQLPASCLVSVAGEHLGTLGSHRECALADGNELVLIAPVAGG